MALIDKYTKNELIQIVNQSKSLNEVIDKLGYSTHCGNNNKTVKNRLDSYEIDYSHLGGEKSFVKRNEDNVFVLNSTASQQTLRRWYLKGGYTQYECSICGQLPIWQGKKLTLILDHINGENHDNRLENLRWVCPNCNQQLDTTGFKKMRVNKLEQIEKKYYCIDCGKQIHRGSERCVSCSSKIRRSVERPTREILKSQIRYMSFVELGKKYGVSDNAVKKWCISYNLPSKKKDINNISDIDWELI